VKILDQNTKPAPHVPDQASSTPASDDAGHFVPHPETASTPEPAPALAPSNHTMRSFLAGLVGGSLACALYFVFSLLFNPTADLSERLTTAESNLAATATRRGLETTDKRLAALEARFDPLRNEIESLNRAINAANATDVAPLIRRLSLLESTVAALKPDAAPEKNPLPLALSTETAKLSLALLISDRLETGQAFPSELAALELLGLDPTLQPLLRDAANGSPSQVQVLARYTGLLPQLRKAVPVDPKQNWTDKLWQQVNAMVRVRRIDDPQSTDPESRLQVIALALQAARNDEALKQFSQLPDAMRNQGRDFETLLHKRLAALAAGEALLKATSDEVLNASRSLKGPVK
jgi:hypothetical protein